MNLLAIDTASTSGSIALMKDDRIVACQFMDIQITHSERLMPQIDQIFQMNKMKPSELDGVLLANGPGSFTGIRIGLSTAKGICFGIEKPLIPYNNLEMLAINLAHADKPILSVIDARMNEIYAALYDPSGAELISPFNGNIHDLVEQINHKELFVIGDDIKGLYEALMSRNIKIHYPLVHQNIPLASALFSLFKIKKSELNWDFDFLSRLEPFYLRSSIAQIDKRKENV